MTPGLGGTRISLMPSSSAISAASSGPAPPKGKSVKRAADLDLSHIHQHPGDQGSDLSDNEREVAILDAGAAALFERVASESVSE